jgi:hypothetical protein
VENQWKTAARFALRSALTAAARGFPHGVRKEAPLYASVENRSAAQVYMPR